MSGDTACQQALPRTASTLRGPALTVGRVVSCSKVHMAIHKVLHVTWFCNACECRAQLSWLKCMQ